MYRYQCITFVNYFEEKIYCNDDRIAKYWMIHAKTRQRHI